MWSLTWGVQEQNMGTYILWTFLHLSGLGLYSLLLQQILKHIPYNGWIIN